MGAWFSALALVVAGPLLGPGYVLLLDYPSGPQFPTISPFPLPSSGDIGNGIPLLSALALAREIHDFLPDKLLLLAPIVVGGIGVYRLARTHLGVGSLSAIYGGTLLVVNPFVYDRYLSGHLFFLLAYSLLPWAVAPLLELTRRPSLRTTLVIALWIFALGAIDVHVLGMYLLLACIAAVLAPSRLRLAFGAAALGAGALASAYWILPALFVDHGGEIGAADLNVYASRPRGQAVLPTLLGLDGFWRNEFTGPGERMPVVYLLLVPILGLAVAGAVQLLRLGPFRRFAVVLSVGAALGLILAAGTSLPLTTEAFRWAFEHVPYMGVYREPQKLLALVVLAYAIFGSVGLDSLVRAAHVTHHRWSAPSAVALSTVAVAVVLGYGYTMFWGFAGQAQPVRYPGSWADADAVMEERGEGRLLVFPWHLYTVWSFSDGRIVANPAPSFFSREVLAGDEAGFTSVGQQSPDPFSRYVAELLQHRSEIRWLGHLVSPLGVRFVVSLREADWHTYRFLRRQQDLERIYSGKRLVLFENRAWRGEAFGLEATSDLAGIGESLGSDREREVATSLLVEQPRVPRVDGGVAILARSLLRTEAGAPTATSSVAIAARCTDGWKLDGDPAACHAGAVAAFPTAVTRRHLWRPVAGVQLVGLVVSGLTLVSTGFYLLFFVRSASRGRE